jgi:hypothetical protein
MLIGGLEASSTKMVCAIGNEHGTIFDKITVPANILLEKHKDDKGCLKLGYLAIRDSYKSIRDCP